jgi:Zn-dependent protease
MEPNFQVLPPDRQAPPPTEKPTIQSYFGAIIAGLIAVVKYFKTSLSMVLMIWVYSWYFGWIFAAGFVFLIFVHEMGHVIAAKWLGIPVTAPVFIPFIGAAILMKQNPRDAWTEALMAYGGPLAGCIGSWIAWYASLLLNQDWLMAVASASFIINLFNLIPFQPLDGGRICAAISTWFWVIGLMMLAAAVFYFHAIPIWLVALILFVAFPRIKETFLLPPTPEMQRYYTTHISNRLTMALMYLGLIAALLLGYWDASQHLSYLSDNGG